ncbi:N-acetylneuraminate synthase family protein [Luminiphilus sp.]|nr:N-acetylneuraminate synthase family protein [Luminiphilus sp.]
MAGWSSGAPYIIAEIGVNHNGSVDFACELVSLAKSAGASAVKFQTFTAEELAGRDTPKVAYQLSTTDSGETHFAMLKALELDVTSHEKVMEHCRALQMPFISTPYTKSAVDMLESLGVDEYKVASADIIDIPLLKRIARTRKPVILSLGMASLGEVERALQCFEGYEKENVCLLHCVSNYPCADESVNLRVLLTLRSAFGFPVGLSDHSLGATAAIAATALGACVVEKHFTSDRGLPGPDHRASSEPDEFSDLVKNINRVSVQMGEGVKKVQAEEKGMAAVSRKSVVYCRNLRVGHVLLESDLTMRRPGGGLTWDQAAAALGAEVIHRVEEGQMLEFRDLRWPD